MLDRRENELRIVGFAQEHAALGHPIPGGWFLAGRDSDLDRRPPSLDGAASRRPSKEPGILMSVMIRRTSLRDLGWRGIPLTL